MPSITDRVLGAFGYQRSALLPSVDQVMQMSGWYAAMANAVPTMTLNQKVEPISSGFRELTAGAYASNPIIFACMQARANLFSEARFQFQKMQDGVPGELFNRPETYLRLLDTPWPGGNTSTLLREMITDADLSGNAFVARRPNQLQRLRPDWTVIIAGSPNSNATTWDLDTEILGYGYQPDGPAGGKEWITLDRSEVAHFRAVVDPLRRFSGMSWLVPIIREIMADQAATSHKLNYFNQGATPNLIVKFDQTMTKGQADDWVRLFNQKHEGAANAYKTLFLGGGSDATVVGANLQQADFSTVQGGGEMRIAGAAGVPGILIGLTGAAGSALSPTTYQQARRAFADLTMRPLWRDACGALSTITTIPQNSRLWFDERGISFLQEDMQDAATIQSTQAQSIRTLIDTGYKADSVVEAVIAQDFTRLEHTGLFSVQLQAPGSTKMPQGEAPGETPVGAGMGPEKPAVNPAQAPAKQLMNSAEFASVEIRCSGCDKLVGKRTAPGGSFEVKCERCKNLVTA